MYGPNWEGIAVSDVLGRSLTYEAKSDPRDDRFRLRWGDEVVWKAYSHLPRFREVVAEAAARQTDPREVINALFSHTEFLLAGIKEERR